MSNITLEGLDDVLNRISSIQDMENMQKALGKCCALVERSAKQKCLKVDGDLRRSIKSRVDGLQGIVFSELEYAPYVEYGTGLFAENGNGRKDVPWTYRDDKGEFHATEGMKPAPYLRPALEEQRQKIIETLRGALIK